MRFVSGSRIFSHAVIAVGVVLFWFGIDFWIDHVETVHSNLIAFVDNCAVGKDYFLLCQSSHGDWVVIVSDVDLAFE